MAFLVVLEALSPLERVAFGLHDLFAFDYAEIAVALDRSESALRQLVSRARRHVREHPRRAMPDPAEHLRVTKAFMLAATEGDVNGLLDVLAPDVVVLTDGGGAAKAARHPVCGADKAARFLAAISTQATDVSWRLAEVNGRIGVLLYLTDQLIGALDLDTGDGVVGTVRLQVNPAKLAGITGFANSPAESWPPA